MACAKKAPANFSRALSTLRKRLRLDRCSGSRFLVFNDDGLGQYNLPHYYAIANVRVIHGGWQIWANRRPGNDMAFRIEDGRVLGIVIPDRGRIGAWPKHDVVRIGRVGHDRASSAGCGLWGW